MVLENATTKAHILDCFRWGLISMHYDVSLACQSVVILFDNYLIIDIGVL